MASDAQLLQAWRSGDLAAREALVRRHYPSVLRFFELGATWAAEDLTQRTFMALLEKANEIDPARSVKPYLFGIARNQLAMYLRHLARTQTGAFAEEAEPVHPQTRLSMIVARGEQQRALLRALVTLDPDLRAAIVLHYWEGLPSAEIGQVLEIPPSTIRGRLVRARELLARQLHQIAPSAPVPGPEDLEGWIRALGASRD